MYAIVKDNTILEFPILSLHQKFPNISFPTIITDADLPPGVVKIHLVPPTSYNHLTQKPVQDTVPVFINGQWELGYSIVELNTVEIKNRYDNAVIEVRQNRNILLSESDWTQLPDAPVDKTLWAVYRQQLRDVTAQSGFPLQVIWPQPPV